MLVSPASPSLASGWPVRRSARRLIGLCRRCISCLSSLGDLSGAELVHFLNAVLASGCSLSIFLGLWPFKGLFHAWFYKRVPYNWAVVRQIEHSVKCICVICTNTRLRLLQHTMMAWFEVGCIGLLTANVLAYRTFTDETSKEAHDLVYTVNLVMHFLWGLHNLHLSIKGFFYDKGADNEFRRPQVFGIYSLTGAARNYSALTYGPSDEATKATWTIEWASLAIVLLDLLYFLAFEHT